MLESWGSAAIVATHENTNNNNTNKNTLISNQRIRDYEAVLQKQKTIEQIVAKMDNTLTQNGEEEQKQPEMPTLNHNLVSIPLKSSILLGPLTKYAYYGQFPFKVAIHLVVCVLAGLLAFQQNRMDQEQFLPQVLAFYFKFLLRDDVSSINTLEGKDNRVEFYKVPEMRDFITNSTQLYFDFNNEGTEDLINTIYTAKDEFVFKEPQVHFKYDDKYVKVWMNDQKQKHPGQVLPYYYQFKDRDDTGPFTNNTSTKELFQTM